ncbi:hypothetical protein ACFY3J_15500 [Streptomyces sp. NPDC001231]|uniref:hypothetical protein n=1 Tax=Streptomyces sp. NPDC001231 TaxID=3364549 RepID=UPI0036C87735
MLYWYSRASTAETLSGSLRMAACDRDKLPLREWRLTYTGALLPQLRLCGQPFSRSAVQRDFGGGVQSFRHRFVFPMRTILRLKP